MKVKVNGREENWFTPRLMLGTMRNGMDNSRIHPNEVERMEYIVWDLTEQDLARMSFFDLTSYMLGFKAGESHVRSQF